MKRCIRVSALAAATIIIAACSSDDSSGPAPNADSGGTVDSGGSTTIGDAGTDTAAPAADAADGSTSVAPGKAFFKTNVFPFLDQKCSSCHNANALASVSPYGVGSAWMTPGDAEASYAQMFQRGWVELPALVTVTKPVHAGVVVTAELLSAAEVALYNQWVALEAAPKVLEKLGTCFDQTKFDAMMLGAWVSTLRTINNNTNNVVPWNENPNGSCIYGADVPCRVCHSADAATRFKNAVGNSVVMNTFEESKLASPPPYITMYFGMSLDGKPIASNAIRQKSDATKKDKPCTHPMFTLTTEQLAALDAFVNDVIAKYTAGTCGK